MVPMDPEAKPISPVETFDLLNLSKTLSPENKDESSTALYECIGLCLSNSNDFISGDFSFQISQIRPNPIILVCPAQHLFVLLFSLVYFQPSSYLQLSIVFMDVITSTTHLLVRMHPSHPPHLWRILVCLTFSSSFLKHQSLKGQRSFIALISIKCTGPEMIIKVKNYFMIDTNR